MAEPKTQGTGTFPWTSDIGVSSIAGMTALCRSSGVPFTIGSAFRPGATVSSGRLSWHAKQNAIDVFGTPQNMKDLGAYLIMYSEFLLELIHAVPSIPTRGYFADNGKVVPWTFFAGVYDNHINHLHLATTNSALEAAVQATPRLRKQWRYEYEQVQKQAGTQVQPEPGTDGTPQAVPTGDRPGCLKKAAGTAALAIITAPFTPAAAILYTLL